MKKIKVRKLKLTKRAPAKFCKAMTRQLLELVYTKIDCVVEKFNNTIKPYRWTYNYAQNVTKINIILTIK